MDENHTFPFGKPVLQRRLNITEPRQLFILGAYPSALHVFWRPPKPYKPVRAIAIDNEPDFFWDGENEERLIIEWKKSVNFDNSWGDISVAMELNGSSGKWVRDRVLVPLGFTSQKAWLTDCLDTYRCSQCLAVRIENTYAPFASRINLTAAKLLRHPNEDEIVKEALSNSLERLKAELVKAKPETIVTLGNAALRVFKELVLPLEDFPRKLSSSIQFYGSAIGVRIGDRQVVRWIPLAHPAAPQSYQKAHTNWIEKSKNK
ncbi:hypothetical protein L0337_29340 [candidate division KSB1 bacterium]|nr:hypothetical protein [candidate division KSB1 bacterium]